ncbi:MAG: GNAT family N-acetyltransferase [Clostridia bacterium]|nr:GNAT family N-acetyltransferase [Clostridia bacterium]
MTVRFAGETDRAFWFTLDRHLPEEEFSGKVRSRQAYVLENDAGGPSGLLRWNLFWDSIPFCTLLYVREDERGKGFGRMLIDHWERDMRSRGYGFVMTSTQADEAAQHFYRRLGYRDCGGFVLPFPGYEQPTELILAKEL